MISAVVSGVSAEVGSSSTMNSGPVAMARAIATRCCRPPLISAGRSAASAGFRPTSVSNSPIRASRCGGAMSVCSASISPTTSRTVQRGFIESNGSWNTICSRAR